MRRGLEAIAWTVALGALVLIAGDLFLRSANLRAENLLLERYGQQPLTIANFSLGDTVVAAQSASVAASAAATATATAPAANASARPITDGRELLLIVSTPCYACAKALAPWRRLVKEAAWRQGDSVTWVSVGDGEIPVSLRAELTARGVPWRSLRVSDRVRFETTTGIAVAPIALLRVGANIVHVAAGVPSERMHAALRDLLAATATSSTATFTKTRTVERLSDVAASARATELGACVAYDAHQLALVQETGADASDSSGVSAASGASSPPSTWIVRDQASAKTIAHGATRADAERILAIAKRHRALCAIGEGRAHAAAVLRYWEPLATSDDEAKPDAPPAAGAEDCMSYDVDAVTIETDGPDRWQVLEGRHLIAVMTTEQDAKLAWRLMVRHRAQCFIGRGNTQSDQARYITQYWK